MSVLISLIALRRGVAGLGLGIGKVGRLRLRPISRDRPSRRPGLSIRRAATWPPWEMIRAGYRRQAGELLFEIGRELLIAGLEAGRAVASALQSLRDFTHVFAMRLQGVQVLACQPLATWP